MPCARVGLPLGTTTSVSVYAGEVVCLDRNMRFSFTHISTCHSLPGALFDVVSTYIHLLHDLSILSRSIVMMGDSAGGGLVVAAMLFLRDHGATIARELGMRGGNGGIPMPVGCVLCSPWVSIMGATFELIYGVSYTSSAMSHSLPSLCTPTTHLIVGKKWAYLLYSLLTYIKTYHSRIHPLLVF